MENRTVRLRVDGWQASRYANVSDKFLMFEVMSLDCACASCFQRLVTVTDRMMTSETKWLLAQAQIPERGGETMVILVIELEKVPEKVDAFLSDLLGLQISEIAETIN